MVELTHHNLASLVTQAGTYHHNNRNSESVPYFDDGQHAIDQDPRAKRYDGRSEEWEVCKIGLRLQRIFPFVGVVFLLQIQTMDEEYRQQEEADNAPQRDSRVP